MKLDFNLQVSQKQGLALTAQVQQAIKLLQMTNTELAEFVDEQFSDNPFIDETNFSEKLVRLTSDQRKSGDIDKSFEANPYKQTSAENQISRENQFEMGESYVPKSTVAKDTSDFDFSNLIPAEEKSIYAYCSEFSASLNFEPYENIIAHKLIEALEPTGWITDSLNDIAMKLNTTLENVEKVLSKLQTIEPAGLFARNLKECLKLQAVENEIYCTSMEVVLDNLHLVGSGKFDLLKRRSGCTDDTIADIFRKIKSLNPKPGLIFDSVDIPIREPDLRVFEGDEGWQIELNNSTLPDIKISKEYAKELTKTCVSKSDREFVREKITEAKWLQNAVNKRNDTMLKVGKEIVKRQIDFLEKGAQFIKPMILSDIAQAVDMHESTISRVTTGSLIQTPRGTMELKAFFSIGINQGVGTNAESASSIRHRIKKLIEQEKEEV